jgi:glycosyltransferase involved in cell wall biosynthesis
MAMLGDKTICVSEAVRKSLIEHYDFPARNVVTILNGVDVSEFAPSESTRSAIRARLGLRADDFVMVATARLSKVKAPEILVRAFAEVIERGHPCKCILVGDGPLREQVQDQVRNLGLSEHAIFVGFQADVKPFLQAADLFVLTSWQEGMSLALLEALACALPCVVTNVGGNAEVISNSQDGFVVEPGEVSKIADAISYLVERPEERRRMAGQAREKAEQTFDIRVCLKAIEQEMFGEWASRR